MNTPNPPPTRRAQPLFLLLTFLFLALPGCLSERSFPMRPDHLVKVPNPDHLAARPWAARLHTAAAPLLPRGRTTALTTDQLSNGSSPTDVWAHFHLHPDQLDNIFTNYRGIEQIAQTVSPPYITIAGHVRRPGWDGFHDVLVPVGDNVTLYGRLGDPDPENEIKGSYVIITHGLFGSLDGLEVINNVQALRHAGHHVLAVEMRGHGETDCLHPEYAISFGLNESSDFLNAALWLKSTQGAARVGLVSFSLTGYEALLTAWLDGKVPASDLEGLPLNVGLPQPQPQPVFNAGMFIVSTPVNLLQIANDFGTRMNMLQAPVKSTFQSHIAERLATFKQPPGFSMWDLARCEFNRSAYRKLYPSFEIAQPDLVRFLDMSRDHWKIGIARMENIRVPVLVLNSANDPLGSAQGVADLFSQQHNPNLGVILLPEGSHIGFSAYSADYYYTLMTNFFNPLTAPVAVQ